VIARALAAALALGLLLTARADAADALDRLMRPLNLTALPAARATDFSLPSVGGGKVSLAEQQGKVVLVYFWATWCPYCRRELPAGIEQVTRERRGQPFTVLAVSIEEPRDLVASYAKGAGLTSSVLLDGDGAVAREYRVRATPTAIVIGRDGRLVARAAGTRDWDGKAGRAFLDALVAAPAK
jgi:peroxiredoxin